MNMNYNILLLEDDMCQADALEKIIKEYSSDICVTKVSTLSDAVFILEDNTKNKNFFDVFFLDISLDIIKNEEGLILADKIRSIFHYNRTPIIFTTAFPEHISSAINNTHCFAYLLKPYTKKEVHRQLYALFNYRNTISIKTLDNIHMSISLDSLKYIKSNGRYLDFVTASTHYYSRQYTLKKLIKILPDNFVRCHKSYIVNKTYISNFDFMNYYVNLFDINEPIPISRNFRDENL